MIEPEQRDFPSFEDALRVKWNTLHSTKRRGPKLPPVFVYWSILLEFHALHERFPSVQDTDEVMTLATRMCEEHEISKDLLDETRLNNLASVATVDMTPICAIMGGMIGQEVVKAISQKDEPICNFFFYDALQGNGRMRRIGNIPP